MLGVQQSPKLEIGTWVYYMDGSAECVGEVKLFSDDGKTVFVKNGVTRKFNGVLVRDITAVVEAEATA